MLACTPVWSLGFFWVLHLCHCVMEVVSAPALLPAGTCTCSALSPGPLLPLFVYCTLSIRSRFLSFVSHLLSLDFLSYALPLYSAPWMPTWVFVSLTATFSFLSPMDLHYTFLFIRFRNTTACSALFLRCTSASPTIFLRSGFSFYTLFLFSFVSCTGYTTAFCILFLCVSLSGGLCRFLEFSLSLPAPPTVSLGSGTFLCSYSCSYSFSLTGRSGWEAEFSLEFYTWVLFCHTLTCRSLPAKFSGNAILLLFYCLLFLTGGCFLQATTAT